MSSYPDTEDLRIALEVRQAALIEAAGDLPQAVKDRTDDPLLYALAENIAVALKLERRIRLLLKAQVQG